MLVASTRDRRPTAKLSWRAVYTEPVPKTKPSSVRARAHRGCGHRRRNACGCQFATALADEDTEREIPFMKGYTLFNVEQVDGLL